MDLKGAVRELRLQLELSQTDFGSRLGVSLPTITRWERGGPPVDAYEQLIDEAENSGRSDIADVFRADLEKRYGRFLEVRQPDYSRDERRHIATLIRALRQSSGEGKDHVLGQLQQWEKIYPPKRS